MKNHKLVFIVTLIVLAAIALGVLGYVWAKVGLWPTKNQSEDIFSCNPSSVKEYSVSSPKGDYTLVRTETGWQVEDDEFSLLNQTTIEKIINSASTIKALGTISKKDFRDFDDFSVRILEIETYDDKEIELKFLGSKGEISAFSVDDDPRIYTMYTTTRNILTPPLDNLRDTEVFAGLSQGDVLPQKFSYTKSDGYRLEIRTKTPRELSENKKNGYIMVSPFKKTVDDDKFEQKIVLKIAEIKAEAFVSDASKNLAGFGLDEESRSALSVTLNSEEQTLYIGKEEGSYTYAQKKGDNSIIKISCGALEFLETDPFYLIEGSILKSDADDIQSITVKTLDEFYSIESFGLNTDYQRFLINGNTASENVFKEIIEEIEDIDFLSELTTIPENKGDIVIAIIYNNSEKNQTISLTKLKNGNYAAFIDGKAEFSVDGNTIGELLEELREAANKPMKTGEKG